MVPRGSVQLTLTPNPAFLQSPAVSKPANAANVHSEHNYPKPEKGSSTLVFLMTSEADPKGSCGKMSSFIAEINTPGDGGHFF